MPTSSSKDKFKRKADSRNSSLANTAKPAKKARKAVESEPELESEDDVLDAVEEVSDDESQAENSADSYSNMDSGESENSEDEETAVNADSEHKQSSADAHAEQRRLKKERKLQRSNGAQIQQIKKIWEKLRQKSGVSKEERVKLVEQTWELAKDSIKDLTLKHDASRVIQTLFKHADKAKKDAITAALKGSYTELAKSSYGKYLLVKMLHYGSKEVRASVVDEMHGQFRKLMKHKEGAYVIEDMFCFYTTPQQKRQMIREFFGSEYAVFKDLGDVTLSDILEKHPEKRQFLMRNLKETITAAVNKGSIGFNIIHAAMLEYVSNISLEESTSDGAIGTERAEFVELVSPQFPEIVHTAEGSKVASIVLAIATAKERKSILKTLKQFAEKLASDDNGALVLTSVFMTVDDTKLVEKTFNSELKSSLISELILKRTTRRPYMYLLGGRLPNYFDKATIEFFSVLDKFKANTSKKDDDVRRKEVLKAFLPVFLDVVASHAHILLNSENAQLGSQFVAEVLLNAACDSEIDTTSAMEATVDAVTPTLDARAMRPLIQGGHWDNKEKKVNKIVSDDWDFAQRLCAKIQPDALKWATGENGSGFLVLALLETLDKDDKKDLLKALKKDKAKIQQSKAKGSDLILKQL